MPINSVQGLLTESISALESENYGPNFQTYVCLKARDMDWLPTISRSLSASWSCPAIIPRLETWENPRNRPRGLGSNNQHRPPQKLLRQAKCLKCCGDLAVHARDPSHNMINWPEYLIRIGKELITLAHTTSLTSIIWTRLDAEENYKISLADSSPSNHPLSLVCNLYHTSYYHSI